MSWRWLWPFRRKRKPPSPELRAAQRKLDEVAAKDPEVFHLAERLREIREQNNFAALFGGTSWRDRR